MKIEGEDYEKSTNKQHTFSHSERDRATLTGEEAQSFPPPAAGKTPDPTV